MEEDEPLPLALLHPGMAGQRGRNTEHDTEHAAPSWGWAWALSFGLMIAAAYTVADGVLQASGDQWEQAIQSGSTVVRLLADGWTAIGSFGDAISNALSYALGGGGSIMWSGAEYLILFAAFGACGVLLLRRYWRKAASAVLFAGLGALLLGAPGSARAAEVRRSPDVNVPAGETIQNDLIASGARVRVDGTVNGDLIAFTRNLEMNGRVTGDVIVFGDQVRLGGTVDGNVRCFCNTLELDGSIGRNVSALAARIDLAPRSAIGGGIISVVGRAALDGKVGRDLLMVVRNAAIDGAVGGDATLMTQNASVGPDGKIAGQLEVTSNQQPEISGSAKLGRPLSWKTPPRRSRARDALVRIFIFRHIVGYIGALLCGLLLINLFPGFFVAGAAASKRVGTAMGIGALVLASSGALLIFSIILLVAGVWAGLAAAALYLPAVYASQIFVGAWIGEKWLGRASGVGQLALGLLVVRLAGLIPFLGFFVWVAVLLWGIGAVSMAIWNRTRLDAAPMAA